MFDDYPSPPSTPSSSSRLRSIPHLHCNQSSHINQRASKASDIAHLLDPSYSPTRTTTYLNQIYVDHAGEAHDPDFRLFALAGYSPKRREFLTCTSEPDVRANDDDDDDADDNTTNNTNNTYPVVDAYEDDDAASFALSYRSHKRASFESARSAASSSSRQQHTYRPDSRASDPVYSRTVPDVTYATFTYTFEEQGYLSDDEPPREVNKLRRRRASLEHDRADEAHPESESESPVAQQQQQQQQQQQKPRADRTACTASASTIRRQWHALRLRTQVAAFHARKRVTRIVSG